MMNFKYTVDLIKYFGFKWLIYRIAYSVQKRFGWLELKLPSYNWSEKKFPYFIKAGYPKRLREYFLYRKYDAPRFFFSVNDKVEYKKFFKNWDDSTGINPQNLVKDLLNGKYLFFGKLSLEVGYPPNWFKNAITSDEFPARKHWSRISDFEFGDIRVVWELNRFGFVYWLVRSYWRTDDESYARIFWELVEDWREKNPPYRGPNWKCGQEVTFRLMAWIFGLYGFLDSSYTTPERIISLAQMIWASGVRIEKNIHYALNQKNNHGISEATGLWTIGLLFPEFRFAEKWREIGKILLEKQGEELIYNDGGFSQYSSNYHRVMLHDYLWAVRLGELNGEYFSKSLVDKIAKAGNFIYQIQDENGEVPMYGQNDGSLIFQTNNCNHRDFRPIVQSISVLTERKRMFHEGPWDEDILWFFGPKSLDLPLKKGKKVDFIAKDAGCSVIRGSEGFAFVRCGNYKHRPSHADMLHVDIWWKGVNIAKDPGTFSYNFKSPWNNPFAHTIYHNTVTVDDMDQMQRIGKFLWLPWVYGEITNIRSFDHSDTVYWEGKHNGYLRLADPVIHRRGVLKICGETWLIIDHLRGSQKHKFRLHWLLSDFPHKWIEGEGKLMIKTPYGPYYVNVTANHLPLKGSLVRSDEKSPRGWIAPFYSYREPGLSLALEIYDYTSYFITIFSPFPVKVYLFDDEIQLSSDNWKLIIPLLIEEQDALLGEPKFEIKCEII